MSAPDLAGIPAVAQLAERGARFVLWKNVPDRDKPGKRKKLPLQVSGEVAASTRPETWAGFHDVVAAAKRRRVDGVGFVFNGDGIGGVDLDGCRDPATGEISPWAREVIVAFASYAEVSPSGTGVKVFAAGAPPSLAANKLSIGTEPAFGGEHPPQIETWVTGRYFAITGLHLDGTPDEIVDATEAWERLAHRLRAAAGPEAGEGSARADFDHLPELLREMLAGDEKLRAAWASGENLTKGRDATASGKDFSLLVHLARREHDDEQIELALRHYQHGQIGSGELAGRNADRRIRKLLQEAEKIRTRARRWREANAWFDELLTTEQGSPRDCLANGAIILRGDPSFVGRVRFDEHRQGVVCRDLPWRPGGDWRDWTDRDDIRFAEWCQLREVPLTRATCADAVAAVADDDRVHPIREYLDGLAWDGTPRLATWLFTHLGAEVEPGRDRPEAKRAYLREVGRKWPIGAVARVYRPGCKADAAPIFEGEQGIGKSQALAALVPCPEWFCDEISDLGTKDSAQDLRGKWIIELAELSAMRRGDIERTKAFMSRSTDHYRPSYGRRSQDFPRQCVLAGTTNADAYLGDETGNRRFWPVKVGAIDLDAIRRDRDQFWAEAVAAFKAGERWWLDAEVEKAAADEQDYRRLVDPWEPRVLTYCDGLAEVTVTDVLDFALVIPADRQDQAAMNRVARILRGCGWSRRQRRAGGARAWVYLRPEASPVSPVDDESTGDRKASNSRYVTGVTGVTGRSGASGKGCHHRSFASGEGGGGGPAENLSQNGGDTGDTGDARPAWRDLDAWRDRLKRAEEWSERTAIVLDWGRAAGGTVDTTDEVVRLNLPPDLPNSYPAVELRRLARELRIAS